MSCTCRQPVRPEFKDSYKDLLDKPQINGVTLSGNLTAADLGIKAGVSFKIVTALPTTDIDPLTIYLVPASVSGENNFYQEFIYTNNAWEKVGEPITMDVGGSHSVELLEQNIMILNTADGMNILGLSDLISATGYVFKNNTTYICNYCAFEDASRCILIPPNISIFGNADMNGGDTVPGWSIHAGGETRVLAFDFLHIINGYVFFRNPTAIQCIW